MDSGPRPSAPKLACRAFPPERFLLPAVHLFDPGEGVDFVGDLLVEDGKIAAMGERLPRDPGRGGPRRPARAAGSSRASSIRTRICALPATSTKRTWPPAPGRPRPVGTWPWSAMANTDPVVDSGTVASWVLEPGGRRTPWCASGQVGSVSKGLKGEELSEMRELADAGVVAFADDGKPVSDADLLLHALRYARGTGRPLLLHLENKSLSLDGVMHEGKWSARLGLRGIPAASESGPLARDLELVRYAAAEEERLAARARRRRTAARRRRRRDGVPLVHFQHLSAADSVRLVAGAKREGLPVTAEATPLHLLLHRRAPHQLRPEPQGQPAHPLGGRPRRPGGRAGRRHHRLHRHRPRSARPAGEGSAHRGGPERQHRAGDGLRRAAHRPGADRQGAAGPAGGGHVERRPAGCWAWRRRGWRRARPPTSAWSTATRPGRSRRRRCGARAATARSWARPSPAGCG